MNNYVTFRKFPDAAQAKQLQQFLLDNGIECIFVNSSSGLDSNFSSALLNEYEIQMSPADFERAGSLIENHAKNMIKQLPEDYYLFSFTDEELFDVILKHDEWSEFDYVLARRLLAERGKAVDEELIKSLRSQRLADLAKPEDNQKAWVFAGYVLALLGGFFGVITGYVLWTSKKTLPNGEVVPTYTQSDRMHGKAILITGLIVMPLYIIIRLLEWV